MLEYPLWKAGLLQILFHFWLSAQVSRWAFSRFFPQQWGEGFRYVCWLLWFCSPYQGLSAYYHAHRLGDTSPATSVLSICAGSHTPQGVYVHGWMFTLFSKGGDKKEDCPMLLRCWGHSHLLFLMWWILIYYMVTNIAFWMPNPAFLG